MATLSFNRLYVSTLSSACAAVLLTACGGSGLDAEQVAQAESQKNTTQSVASAEASSEEAPELDPAYEADHEADAQEALEEEIEAKLAAEAAAQLAAPAEPEAEAAPASTPPLATAAEPVQTLAATTAVDPRFAAGGAVEAEVWALWDGSMRASMQKMLQDRLVGQGDVYALYDFQQRVHNIASMARRTGKTTRLIEMSRMIRIAYNRLRPASIGSQWLCTGGTICTNYGLIGKEVKLDSAQFLGLAATIASGLAESRTPLTAEAKTFINDTATILAEHLTRWGDASEVSRLNSLAKVKASDIKTGTASYSFLDHHVWHLTMHANLSNLRQWQRNQGIRESAFIVNNHTRMRSHFVALLNLYTVRTEITRPTSGPMAGNYLAIIDPGFWRLYSDMQYAGYESTNKPVVCSPTKRLVVPVSDATRDPRGSWDISHARRLVHAVDAMARHRAQMQSIYTLTETQMGSTAKPKALAASLLARVWNQNSSQPLFKNYMSGKNGWYQASYSSTSCKEGYKPYFQTGVFATGGYITWSKYYPQIGLLGQRLYTMNKDATLSKSPFMVSYYDGLRSTTNKLMFLPTLVAN